MRVKPAVTAALIAAALAGCGSAEQAEGPASQPASSSVRAAQEPLRVAVTEGRIGDATEADEQQTTALFDGDEQIEPGAAEPTERQRDGVAGAAGCADGDLMPDAANLGRIEASTLCLVNDERTSRGLRPLTANGRLAKAAIGHSRDMVSNQYFAHESRAGRDVVDRLRSSGYIPRFGRWTVGENLAWGTGALATPVAIVNAWMNSPGHRSNILNRAYREIGLGVVIGNPARPSGLGGTYTTTFGAATKAKTARRARSSRRR